MKIKKFGTLLRKILGMIVYNSDYFTCYKIYYQTSLSEDCVYLISYIFLKVIGMIGCLLLAMFDIPFMGIRFCLKLINIK
jgi:hypothetical protein